MLVTEHNVERVTETECVDLPSGLQHQGLTSTERREIGQPLRALPPRARPAHTASQHAAFGFDPLAHVK